MSRSSPRRVASAGSLHLEPWSLPPCHGDSEHHRDPAARKLLEQMLTLGVSRWHPDPMAAIDEAKEKDAQAGKSFRAVRRCMTGPSLDRPLAILMEAARPLPPEKREPILATGRCHAALPPQGQALR